jgi:uncharacterized protein (DUF433 family)
MSAYSLNLPSELQKAANQVASLQGISLEQFILSAIADKLARSEGGLSKGGFSQIAYIRGASGVMVPVLKGTGIRIQTLAVARHRWHLSEEQIAREYDLSLELVGQGLLFYSNYSEEIDSAIATEETIEQSHV